MKAYKITDWLIKNNYVDLEEKDIITFGLGQASLIFLNISTVFLLATILKCYFNSIIFCLTFIALRSYAGGYHANTKIKCYISSVIIVTISFLLLNNYLWTKLFCFSVCMVATFIIFKLAPVSNSINPLDDEEIFIYKKVTRKILLMENMVVVISITFNLYKIYSTITVSLILVTVLLILGKIKYK